MNMKRYKRLELIAAAFLALGYEDAYVVRPQTAHDDDSVSVTIHGVDCTIDCKVWCKENGGLPEYTLQMNADAAPSKRSIFTNLYA